MPASFPPAWASAWGTDRLSPYPFVELELAPGVLTRLRWIPPGRFLMGSPEDEKGHDGDEGPQHWVTIAKGYWLADAPCTQAEWQATMESPPRHFSAQALPVDTVTWDDCQAFCDRMRIRFPGFPARLPSEAEWEYACRATTTSAFNDGSPCTESSSFNPDPALLKLGSFRWLNMKNEERTHSVRDFAPNQWGLYDMHGSVSEWCADRFGDYTVPDQVDPTGPSEGWVRVLRGGSRNDLADDCRSASRLRGKHDTCYEGLGFRLASGQ